MSNVAQHCAKFYFIITLSAIEITTKQFSFYLLFPKNVLIWVFINIFVEALLAFINIKICRSITDNLTLQNLHLRPVNFN